MFSFSADKWSAAGDQTFVSTSAFLIKLQIYFQHTWVILALLQNCSHLKSFFEISNFTYFHHNCSNIATVQIESSIANFLFLPCLFPSNTPKLSFYQIFSSFSLSSASLVQIESFIADLIWSAPQSSSSHHHCRALICTFHSCTNCTIKSALKLSDKKRNENITFLRAWFTCQSYHQHCDCIVALQSAIQGCNFANLKSGPNCLKMKIWKWSWLVFIVWWFPISHSHLEVEQSPKSNILFLVINNNIQFFPRYK